MCFEVFWHRSCFPFWHQCWCFGVLVFNLFFDSIFHVFVAILRLEMEPINRAVGSGACGRPPKIEFRRRHRSKNLFIDSTQFLDRFGEDFEDFSARCSVVFCNTNDKCLYTCAVAEPRLAALKI